jgi:hypothetical protein
MDPAEAPVTQAGGTSAICSSGACPSRAQSSEATLGTIEGTTVCTNAEIETQLGDARMRRVLVCVIAAVATADAFSAPLSVGVGGRGAAAVARRASQPAVRPGRVALRSGIKVEGKGSSRSARPRPATVVL